MKKHTKLSMALVASFVLLAMSSSATAITSDSTTNSTVTVDVTSKVAIDITPQDLSYTGMEPGTTVTSTDSGYSAIELENIGSVNISQVWMNASVPSSNPFGSGLASNYDAGNFIQISPTGEIGTASSNNFTFVNRKEFNESNDLSYVFTPSADRWDYGRFRAGDQEFFWAVNATSNACTGANGEKLRVGNKAHNKTATGSADFTSSEYTSYPLTETGNSHGIATGVNITLPSGNTRYYDVLTKCSGDETYTVRTRYNPKATGATDLTFDGTQIEHLLNSTVGSQGAMQPGEHFQVNTSVEVPQGVPQNAGISGLLRVLVSSG